MGEKKKLEKHCCVVTIKIIVACGKIRDWSCAEQFTPKTLKVGTHLQHYRVP